MCCGRLGNCLTRTSRRRVSLEAGLKAWGVAGFVFSAGEGQFVGVGPCQGVGPGNVLRCSLPSAQHTHGPPAALIKAQVVCAI